MKAIKRFIIINRVHDKGLNGDQIKFKQEIDFNIELGVAN